MSNSSLVEYVGRSPNHSGKRTHRIDRITPHCVVGQVSLERFGTLFPSGRDASCNYGISYDGRVALVVDEDCRSWCSSSNENDQRAVTIEVASDSYAPYAFTNKAYNKLVDLCVDICKRTDKHTLLWISDKNKALAYQPKAGEMLLTVHRWFAAKSCPGDWMYSRMGQLASEVTKRLGGTDSGTLYRVQVGAYAVKANADNMLNKIKAAGFDAFITQSGGLYRVQVGAYAVKANADNMMNKIKSAGFDAFVATSAGSTPQKSIDEIAHEVIRGEWGNYPERKTRLESAGYDYSAVQDRVNELM